MVRLAWPGWWLGLLVGVGTPVAAQANVVPPRIELKENYPNPFFPTTTIPFVIAQEVCARGHQPVVSLKIYNVLVQVVAIPVLNSGGGPRVSGPERLDSLRLRCGEYRAFGLPPGGYLVVVTPPTPGRGNDAIRQLTKEDVQRALQAARSGAAMPSSTTVQASCSLSKSFPGATRSPSPVGWRRRWRG